MAEVLVVVAHPDDETLGCGGTLALMAARGVAVSTLMVTDGEGARADPDHAARAKRRREGADSACRALDIRPPRHLDLPDQRLDTVVRLELTRAIEGVIDEVRPTVVLTHDATDLNLDHRIVFDAVCTALRPVPGGRCHTLATFETPSATDYGGLASGRPFAPNLFVDISSTWETKHRATLCYAGELRPAPHPRSPARLKALAETRGTAVGLELVEAFRLIYSLAGLEGLLSENRALSSRAPNETS